MNRTLLIIILSMLLFSAFLLNNNIYKSEKNHMEETLLLPDIELLKLISLGNNYIISDILTAKAMMYYGKYRNKKNLFNVRYFAELLKLSYKLDPKNRETLLLAANLTAAKEPVTAIDILKLGIKHDPEFWKYPELTGYIYFFHLKDSLKAAEYYEIASTKPDHPPYVPSIAARLYSEEEHLKSALRVLNNFYISTKDKKLKEHFKQSINKILLRIKKEQ